MTTKLRVEYTRAADLVADHDQQFVKGGLLVKGQVPAGLALFDPVELELAPPHGAPPVVVAGQIVQLVPGVGVAVAFQASASPALQAAVAAARGAPAAPAAAAPAAARPVDPYTRYQTATVSEKIQIALHGSKDERGMVLRDINKTVHPYVLRNPNLGLDEVVAMAKMATVSPELLKQIAERREWVTRPEIAIALVRNPKMPAPLAIRLLDHVSPSDLRQLAKDTRTRPPIQQAARKKVL